MVQHSVYWSTLSTGKRWNDYLPADLGRFGVLLFFVISGAAMCIASEKTDAKTFLFRRVARIYPPYLVSLVLASGIVFLLSSGQKPFFHFDFSLLLFPAGTGNSTFGVPYWTLIYEMFFYNAVVVLLFLRFSPQHRAWFMTFWCVTVILLSGGKNLDGFFLPNLRQIFLSPMCAFFAAGYVLMYSKKNGGALFWTLASGICMASLVHFRSTPVILIYMILTLGLLALALRWESPPEWTVVLGDCSYGIYLMHDPVVYSFYLAGVGSTLNEPETFGIYFLSALSIAFLFGFFEHEAHKKFLKLNKAEAARSITIHSAQPR